MMECAKEDSACAKPEAEKVEVTPMEQDLQPNKVNEGKDEKPKEDEDDDYGVDKKRHGEYKTENWTVKRVGFKEYTCKKEGTDKVFTVKVGFGKYVALDEHGYEQHYGSYPSGRTGLLSNWFVDGEFVAQIKWSTRCDEDHMTVFRGGVKSTVLGEVQEYISNVLGHEYYAHSNTESYEGKRSRSEDGDD